jgi:KipI family sensor histidine kinase inhibitor
VSAARPPRGEPPPGGPPPGEPREAKPPRIEQFGDAALLVTFAGEAADAANARSHALAAAIEALRADDPRYGRAVPALASVLVPIDPLAAPPADARETIAALAAGARPDAAPAAASGPVVEIPVRYGGADGPDLEAVAWLLRLSPAEVVELHSGTEYRVRFLGFAPGFGYLGPLPPALATARLATPRERVPAGSVAIAGDQTAVYPFDLPGGWRLIGRTEAPMWDARRDPPALLAPGDRVRFAPIR